MERADIFKQLYDQQNFPAEGLQPGDYEKCEFLNCNFSGADLSKISFIDCDFTDCNLSNAKLQDTAFRDVRFIRCKMLGLHFENCNRFLLEMSFDTCSLNHSSLYQLKLKMAVFNHCILHDVDFTEADIPGSSFLNADLTGTIFDQTNLEKADFRGALYFSIHPGHNNIKKACFSADQLSGLLTHYEIVIE